MANLEEEKIINETPDFDSQKEIIREEKEKLKRKKKFHISMGVMVVLIVLIILGTFILLKAYIPYDKEFITGTFSLPNVSEDACSNVNLSVNNASVINLNITDGDTCIPIYNVDYYNNRKVMFNIDVLGDKSFIFNKINQVNSDNKCIVNCDIDNDGWPDLNIDLNGDGTVDINNSSDGNTCNLNCDINYDMIPDINLDTNNDGTADLNIDNDGDLIPDLSIGYLNNKTSYFNIDTDSDGKADKNLVNTLNDKKECTQNCDINGDGFPDYNINLGNDDLINKLKKTGKESTYFNFGLSSDFKCDFLKTCTYKNNTYNNTYINIDIDGDGNPDVNKLLDNGNLTNKLNNKVFNIVLNEDTNNDGFPDYNIDIDGDGVSDLNITDSDGKCIRNCDFNGDGKADTYYQNVIVSQVQNINIDKDYDGKCDYNCDTNNDLIADINIDTDNDTIPDVNIDTNSDNTPDYNIDSDNDGKVNTNITAYGNTCNFNCNDNINVSSDKKCTLNCDTDSDGYPNTYVDINNDGTCDINCDNKINDTDNDYLVDSKKHSVTFDIGSSEDGNYYINNPLTISESNITYGTNNIYKIIINNNTDNGIKYKLSLTNVNTSTNNYILYRDYKLYIDSTSIPNSDYVIKDNIYLKANSSYVYTFNLFNTIEGTTSNFKGTINLDIYK